MTVISRPWHGDESEMKPRRKSGRPKGSKNKKKDKKIVEIDIVSDDDADPATKFSVSGIGIPMPEVATFNNVPREAIVESMTETYWDEKAHRMVLGKVTPMAYVEMWNANLLGFQRDKRGNILKPSQDWPLDKLAKAKKQMQR